MLKRGVILQRRDNCLILRNTYETLILKIFENHSELTQMRDIKDKSTQSHYFIKFINNDTIEQNIEKLKLIYFEFNNTVGPKSISKPELINEFNKLLI